VKRFGLAAMMLSVALATMATYFVRVGIDLHRRGFSTIEVAAAIGMTAAADLAAGWMATTLIRRRHTAGGGNGGCIELE
jgi:hypothetical protein